jgi:hypothetical protein
MFENDPAFWDILISLVEGLNAWRRSLEFRFERQKGFKSG